MEKAEKMTRFKAIFITLLVHFGLLLGLLYMNSDHPEDLIPDFVKEWTDNDKTNNAVANSKKLP